MPITLTNEDMSKITFRNNTMSNLYAWGKNKGFSFSDALAVPDYIVNMSNSYNSSGITNPTCGSNVVNMDNTYRNCRNLTNAVCGPNVVNMVNTYSGCSSLTTAIIGENVNTMTRAYYNCNSIDTVYMNTNNMDEFYIKANNINSNYRDVFSTNNVSKVYIKNPPTAINFNSYPFVKNITDNPSNTSNTYDYTSTLNVYIPLESGFTPNASCIEVENGWQIDKTNIYIYKIDFSIL